MTAQQCTPPQAALVAIDIAKNRHEVLIDPGPGMRRRRLTVPNTRTEHDRLIATLAGLGRPVIVGFEPTGNYHRGLAYRLISAGFEARLISSMALARTREALHNGWDKNDPKDAQVILHMLRIGASTVYSDPGCGRLNDLQELSKTHDMVSRAKTELWHRLLTHYLPLYFPEAERFQGTSRSDWFLALLEQFPTPASITALSKETFVETALGPGWSEGRQGTPARRYLRDGALVHGFAGAARFSGHRDVPAGPRRRPQPDTPTRPDRSPSRGGASPRHRCRAASPTARRRSHHRADHTG